MRTLKILDTIQNFGAAEKYIQLDADFERFIRDRYTLKNIKAIDPDKIVRKFKLKGIVFGNYVSQEERFFFLFKISKQLEALAKIKGGYNLGKNELIIAFGAEGKAKANAHYNPQKQLINLNRGRKGKWGEILKGENSFVHEFGHFLDFKVGRNDKSISHNFSSEERFEKGNEQTKVISGATNLVLNDHHYMAKIDHSKYLSEPVEVWARLFEAAITHHVYKDNTLFSKYFDRNYTEREYYPKKKIFDNKLDIACIKALKQF